MVLESISTGFSPIIFVSIYSFLLLVLINIFYRILVNQTKAKQTKDLISELSKKMKELQKAGKAEEAKKAMSQMMQEQGSMMRMSMKPMLVSLVIVVIFLPEMSNIYGSVSVANLPFTLPYVGASLGWLGWYIIFSIPAAIVIRKLLKISV